jgi:hypothetical protein
MFGKKKTGKKVAHLVTQEKKICLKKKRFYLLLSREKSAIFTLKINWHQGSLM